MRASYEPHIGYSRHSRGANLSHSALRPREGSHYRHKAEMAKAGSALARPPVGSAHRGDRDLQAMHESSGIADPRFSQIARPGTTDRDHVNSGIDQVGGPYAAIWRKRHRASQQTAP